MLCHRCDFVFGWEDLLTKELGLVCCIYHKPREAGESSSEDSSSSSSSSDEDSDSGQDDGAARPVRGDGKSPKRRTHRHDDGCEHDHDRDNGEDGGGEGGKGVKKGKGRHRRRSPNAYERMPKQRHKS